MTAPIFEDSQDTRTFYNQPSARFRFTSTMKPPNSHRKAKPSKARQVKQDMMQEPLTGKTR